MNTQERILNLLRDAEFLCDLLSDGFSHSVLSPKLKEIICLLENNMGEK